jgi:hypothetical protein
MNKTEKRRILFDRGFWISEILCKDRDAVVAPQELVPTSRVIFEMRYGNKTRKQCKSFLNGLNIPPLPWPHNIREKENHAIIKRNRETCTFHRCGGWL